MSFAEDIYFLFFCIKKMQEKDPETFVRAAALLSHHDKLVFK
jgi:hypothetical protein